MHSWCQCTNLTYRYDMNSVDCSTSPTCFCAYQCADTQTKYLAGITCTKTQPLKKVNTVRMKLVTNL
jgi:hypothetical protein